MKKNFRNEKHKELYSKFKNKQMRYFIVLGGGKEEEAAKFTLEDYKKSLEDNNFDGKGIHYDELALQEMKGFSKYELMRDSEKPFYCRVLDNADSENTLPRKSAKGDPVYDSIIDLFNNRLTEIHKKQFVPYSDVGVDLNMENGDKYFLELENKKSFLSSIISFFNSRGSSKDFGWEKETSINEKRYNFLLENLVKANPEEKKAFEEEFIQSIPFYKHEGFFFWPED